MSAQESVYKHLDAKDLSRRRMALKDILVLHDLDKFRAFLKDECEGLITQDTKTAWLGLDDDHLSEVMHMIKRSQPYLGEVFQESRNYFRLKQLLEAQEQATQELKDELEKERGEVPLCVRCKYFREAPAENERPCMHIGALPGDYACPGWTRPLRVEDT